jgi:hypothetical protein
MIKMLELGENASIVLRLRISGGAAVFFDWIGTEMMKVRRGE